MLHGSGGELRKQVCRILLQTKGEKLAFRYAACGLGDQIVKSGEDVHIGPRGCGHKLCPRCGRRRGGRYARRILGWLGNESHGDLWSICLTQQVWAGEALASARDRLAPKVRKFMRWLDRRGLVGAMTVSHPKYSTRAGGPHFHVHVLVEMPAGAVSKLRLLWEWASIDVLHRVDFFGDQCRLVARAGERIAELAEDAGEVDFWNESASKVARAVQYPLRDLAQGATMGLLGGEVEQARRCALELVLFAQGWKMFRAWGRWRKPCPVLHTPAEEERKEESSGEAAVGPAHAVGTVGRIWRAARKGDEEARAIMRRLEGSVRNASDFAARFVKFCRWGWDPGGA